MQIKICGVTDPKLAQFAAENGADYIGLVFHPNSPRHIASLTQAKEIVDAANCQVVAVFVNQDVEEMLRILDNTGITIAQLHGCQARQQHSLLPSNIQRVFAVNDEISNNLDIQRDLLLFDNSEPGSGQAFNHDTFNYTGKHRYFIAGGLNAKNVRSIIDKFDPFGVDVSSGVESSRGVKDKNLIKQFIEIVKNV